MHYLSAVLAPQARPTRLPAPVPRPPRGAVALPRGRLAAHAAVTPAGLRAIQPVEAVRAGPVTGQAPPAGRAHAGPANVVAQRAVVALAGELAARAVCTIGTLWKMVVGF